MKKEEKTNAVRLAEQKKLQFSLHDYSDTDAISGVDVARVLGEDPDRVFKTLVTEGKSGNHYVFVVPVREELDLKKAAIAAGEKSIAMIKSKDLLPLTGYIHGGCSPIGMKKAFRTFIDETAECFDTILFSGGRIGLQIEMAPDDLLQLVPYTLIDLTV